MFYRQQCEEDNGDDDGDGDGRFGKEWRRRPIKCNTLFTVVVPVAVKRGAHNQVWAMPGCPMVSVDRMATVCLVIDQILRL